MLIIVDYRTSLQALENLSKMGEVCLFNASGLVPDYLSGHPDIFITQFDDFLILAPNIPSYICEILKKHQIKYIFGEKPVGTDHPYLSSYNVVVCNDFIIHNRKFTDRMILKYLNHRTFIDVKQSFSRCSLISDGQKLFLTSDLQVMGILKKYHYSCFYIDPSNIILPGMKNGLFGGCCGILNQVIYLNGRLCPLEQGLLENHILETGFNYDILCDSEMLDIGGIYFIDRKY